MNDREHPNLESWLESELHDTPDLHDLALEIIADRDSKFRLTAFKRLKEYHQTEEIPIMGYIDENGRWHSIKSLEASKLPPPLVHPMNAYMASLKYAGILYQHAGTGPFAAKFHRKPMQSESVCNAEWDFIHSEALKIALGRRSPEEKSEYTATLITERDISYVNALIKIMTWQMLDFCKFTQS